MVSSDSTLFSHSLLAWYDQYGRKNLPWQHTRTAYTVWVSEIMLQQTQVKTVIPYFERFMARFPTILSLAQASGDDVLAHWSGLGYYSRARHLHQTAQRIVQDHNGIFPDTPNALTQLPGIGESTAGAISSLAFNRQTAILDGNVKRVLSRYFLIEGYPEKAAVKKQFWQLAQACMPPARCADYTQAIMDFGATCCTPKNPTCSTCPLQATCKAHQAQCVLDYPTKKPAKALPVRQQQFLLLHTSDSQFIYLEKNPPKGLWGGLWCLPTLDIEHCPITHIKAAYAVQPKQARPLLFIKHTFSHFHLQIQAIALEIESDFPHDASSCWLTQEDTHTLGLAKPVNQIIQAFFNSHPQPM